MPDTDVVTCVPAWGELPGEQVAQLPTAVGYVRWRTDGDPGAVIEMTDKLMRPEPGPFEEDH